MRTGRDRSNHITSITDASSNPGPPKSISPSTATRHNRQQHENHPDSNTESAEPSYPPSRQLCKPSGHPSIPNSYSQKLCYRPENTEIPHTPPFLSHEILETGCACGVEIDRNAGHRDRDLDFGIWIDVGFGKSQGCRNGKGRVTGTES